MEYNIHRRILHVIHYRIILVNLIILIGGCLQSTPTFCPFSSYNSGLHHIPIIIRATRLRIPIWVTRISSKVWTSTICSGWNMSKTLMHWMGELFSSFYGTEWFFWIHQGLSYGLRILCEIDYTVSEERHHLHNNACCHQSVLTDKIHCQDPYTTIQIHILQFLCTCMYVCTQAVYWVIMSVHPMF